MNKQKTYLKTFKLLFPFLWPNKRSDLRKRVSLALICLIFIANFFAGQTYTITHGEYFLVWIVMAIFIRQVSGDISALFFKKSEKE